jgi:hypothetical protein
VHLAQRGRPIGEELQALLAEHDVERGVGQRQLHRAAFPPLGGHAFGLRGRARGREHGRAQVEPDDTRAASEGPGRGPRHDAGPAGHVQHALPRAQRGGLDEVARPGGEDARDQVALVVLRHVPAELPL